MNWRCWSVGGFTAPDPGVLFEGSLAEKSPPSKTMPGRHVRILVGDLCGIDVACKLLNSRFLKLLFFLIAW